MFNHTFIKEEERGFCRTAQKTCIKSKRLDHFRCACIWPGGSDDGWVEASVAGNGHRERDHPPSPPQHVVGERLGRQHAWRSPKSIGWHSQAFPLGTPIVGRLKYLIRLSQEFQHHKLHLYVLNLRHTCALSQSERNVVSWVWQLIKFLPFEFQHFHLLYVQMCAFLYHYNYNN